MKSNFLQPKEKSNQHQNNVFIEQRYQKGQNINSTHTSFSVPLSPISSKNPQRKNKLLDRIRSQLIDIKSQVFKTGNHHETPTKKLNRLQKSFPKQFLNNHNTSNIFQSSKLTSNQECNFIQTNSDCLLLKSKLQLIQQKHKQQIFYMTQTLIGLQKQLIQKDKKLEEYEEQIHEELQKFKQQVVLYNNDSQNLVRHISSLETTIENMNQQIIYLKKRNEDDMQQIKKLIIDNHQLTTRQQGKLKEKLKEELKEQLKDNIKQDAVKKVNILTHFRQPSQQSLDSFGIDEFFKLKDSNKQMSQQIILQQNTIQVLESELAKALKQNKNIQRNQVQQLNNIKNTYDKLLNSVKQGLSKCYQSQIQELKNQLSKYTEVQNIDAQDSNIIIPLRKKKSKIVTQTISEIIIVEQDQQYEVTSRRATTPKSQMISASITERQSLKNRVQELQQTIKQLQEQIEHLKTNIQYSYVQLDSIISKEDSLKKLNLTSQQREQIFYKSLIKQYTINLQQSLLSKLFEPELTKQQSLQSISAQMQFIIEKLKIRNYEIQKKLKETQDVLKNRNIQIDELRKHLLQIKQKQSDQFQISKRTSIKIHTLQKENQRLQTFCDFQKQKSDLKLKQANEQIEQLKRYKTQLQKQITKRQQGIRILKLQINDIIKQQDRKRSNMKFMNNQKIDIKNRINQQLQIQSKYFNNIIQDLTYQLNDLKQKDKIKNINDTWKDKQIKQLKTKILKKDEQILTLKNKEAAVRLHLDKLKSQQSQKVSLDINNKNSQIISQKQIQTLLKQLFNSKETIQNLSEQIKYLKKQISNNVPQQLHNIQNIPLQSLLKERKIQFKQKNEKNSLMKESQSKPNKLEKSQLNKSNTTKNAIS